MPVTVTSQDEFNKATVSALRNLYLLAIHVAPAEEGVQNPDVDVRSEIAALDAYAFRAEYAAMPTPDPAPVPVD